MTTRTSVVIMFAAIALFCMIAYWPQSADFRTGITSPVMHSYRRFKSKHAKEYNTSTLGHRSKSTHAKEYNSSTPGHRSESTHTKKYNTSTLSHRSKSTLAKKYKTSTPGHRSKSTLAKKYKTSTPGHRSKSKYAKHYDLPIPDAKHPVIKISSIANLALVERAAGVPIYTAERRHGAVGASNRTIVFRFRTNTSTFLEPAPGAGHLSAMFMGRTGNRMFIYAGLYGIAQRNGMYHVISAMNPLLKLFKLNVTVVDSDRPGRKSAQYVLKMFDYDKRTEYLDPRNDVELVCYFRNWKYIANVMQDLLQHHFRLRDDIQRQADNFLLHSMAKFALTPSDVALIGVHIRRTDLLAKQKRAGRFDSIPSVSYFRHAVAFFDRLFNNQTMYVVCSDDIQWAKANFVGNRHVVFSVGNSADVDFAILASCNHSIISMGTFSQWSAYLAGGVTITYSLKAPTQVPLSAARKRVGPQQNPANAWIRLS